MIDRETVDRIYAAANIVDIIGEYVTLKRKGVNYQACCPFHNEKTPSFIVSPSKGVFKCFGCGKSGNAVTFVMEHEGMTYPEALKAVAKRYGIEVREKELTPEEVARNDNRESMFVLNSWASEYFSDYLWHDPEGISVGLSYFRQKRGFSDATIHKFGLGFCPARGDRMSRAALDAGYKQEFLTATGLSLQREDGSLFDRFRDRVIFPVHNISGRIVAFGGRTLRTDKTVAKYQNSPESEIYSKKRELYGLFFAKKAIQQQDFAIMVEGYTDVISMHQAGVENVVASSGTSLTTEQIRLLGRFTKNITVIYDGDAAGIHASIRGIDMILHEGMNVRVVLLPPEDDPDSFARSHTAAQVQQYIRENEEDFLTFKAKLLLKDASGDPIKKAALINDMVQSIVQIPDPIQRSVYTKECARIMDIDENVLISEVGRKRMAPTGDREAEEFVRRQNARIRSEQRAAAPLLEKSVSAGSSPEALERELVRYLLKYGHCSFDFKEGRNMIAYNVAEVIFAELDMDELEFQDRVYNEILKEYRHQWEELGSGVEVPIHHFINHPDPEVCNVSVDILTSEDNYVPSELWKQKEIHVESEAEMLAAGVPKAVMLYKSKVIERMLKELNDRLKDETLSDEEQTEIMLHISKLNQGKVKIARHLHRLIL
ncbi:MAG TPA: DNA primase [Candidatus Alistipes avicola]|uniref:DNA primase n=1 Tax=Candidatus Alistipes avicola TaxID=2838432 RepID=A0A9D2L4P5_9BACT|nr:DNA primase [uncultured Alistipes sp.]HJA99206.1 DNA primase [Candidatus Alistipes avicola]